jgi:tetratricopeptide (TPR) repeat protein
VGDIFALQEEIAETTARVLLGVLTDRDREAIKSTPVRLDVYEFYLKGRTYAGQKTPEALESAIAMFETALEFDDDYALAYTGLANALMETYAQHRDEAVLRRADAASQRAIELAPQLAETHVSRGRVLALMKRTREAEAQMDIAMSITPALVLPS